MFIKFSSFLHFQFTINVCWLFKNKNLQNFTKNVK
jgi:hypothetical protein